MIEKRLKVSGPGYGARLEGSTLVLRLGASHPFKVEVPAGIKARVEGSEVLIQGLGKQSVGQWAASVLGLRRRNPYTGHGVSDCAKASLALKRPRKAK